MGTNSLFYWFTVAICLFAAYLVCFCLCKVDEKHNKTDERILVPRILYPLTVAVSFVPLLNLVLGMLVIIAAIFAYYINEDFYFRSWLFEKPKQREKKED